MLNEVYDLLENDMRFSTTGVCGILAYELKRRLIMFWDEQADKHGFDVKAVNFDYLEEQLEHNIIAEYLRGQDILDMGCGNGRLIIELAQRFPKCRFTGTDLSPKMIEVAQQEAERLQLKNVSFKVDDAVHTTLIEQAGYDIYDTIITKRLLINTMDNIRVFDNIYSLLKPDGRYLMLECWIEPLRKINKVRELMNEPDIEVHSFNRYLSNTILPTMYGYFINHQTVDFESLYYFVSRIFNAGGKYDSPINQLAAKLDMQGVRAMEGWSPEKMYVLRKKDIPIEVVDKIYGISVVEKEDR